jgi:hypothetical protein
MAGSCGVRRPACDKCLLPRATLVNNNFDTCRTEDQTMLIVLLWSVSTSSLMVSRDWSIEHLPTHPVLNARLTEEESLQSVRDAKGI